MIWTRYNVHLPITTSLAQYIKPTYGALPFVVASTVCSRWPKEDYLDKGYGVSRAFNITCQYCDPVCAIKEANNRMVWKRPTFKVSYRKGKPYLTVPRRAMMEWLTSVCLTNCPHDYCFSKRTITLADGRVRQKNKNFYQANCASCIVKAFADKHFPAFTPLSELNADNPIVTVSDQFNSGYARVATSYYYASRGTGCFTSGKAAMDI